MTPEGAALEAVHGLGSSFASCRFVTAAPVGSMITYVATTPSIHPQPIACVVVDTSGHMITAGADEGDRTVVRTYGPHTFLSEMLAWTEPRRRSASPSDAIALFGFAQRDVLGCAVETFTGRGAVTIEGTVAEGVFVAAYEPGYTPATFTVRGDRDLGTLELAYWPTRSPSLRRSGNLRGSRSHAGIPPRMSRLRIATDSTRRISWQTRENAHSPSSPSATGSSSLTWSSRCGSRPTRGRGPWRRPRIPGG
jgi:hypothetical protein